MNVMVRPSFAEALAAKVEAPGAAELAAVHEVDIVGSELGPLSSRELDAFPQQCSDDLRLPPPPGLRLVSPLLLTERVQSALQSFQATKQSGVQANPEALVAEARMMALVGGIENLKRDIERQRDQRRA